MFESTRKKVIFIDWGLYMHKAIFGMQVNPLKIPATYSCLRKILTTIKLIGLNEGDLVVICIDGRGNWRKDLDPTYKANRKALRKDSGIDWNQWFDKFNELVEQLEISTPFNYIRLDKIEADDIISVGCRYFKDYDCTICSSDTDFHQLTSFHNVKIFSPIKMQYKIVEEDPYVTIQKKIRKEATDNLKAKITSEFEYDVRRTLVSLLSLPEDIEKKCLDKILKVKYNKYNINLFPYESLLNLFMTVYENDNVETYEKALKRH